MKFKRIDVDTVRCIITEEELSENGLELEDFLQNDGKAEPFLRKIISMAEAEVGYKVQGGNVSIQVTVLPEHTLALTFSEKPLHGISDMLANLRAAVENLAKSVPPNPFLDQKSSDVTEDGRDSVKAQFPEAGHSDSDAPTEAHGQKSADPEMQGQKPAEPEAQKQQEEQPPQGFALNGRSSYQLRFGSLERVMQYAKGIQLELPIHTQLYYLERETSYYLLMERDGMDDKQVCRLLSASLEFSQEIYAHEPTKAFIREHGRCILPEQAVEHLQEL